MVGQRLVGGTLERGPVVSHDLGRRPLVRERLDGRPLVRRRLVRCPLVERHHGLKLVQERGSTLVSRGCCQL